MRHEESNSKDKEFLWTVFKKTGLIGAYLMYRECSNEDKGRIFSKRLQRLKDGKRADRIIQ